MQTLHLYMYTAVKVEAFEVYTNLCVVQIRFRG